MTEQKSKPSLFNHEKRLKALETKADIHWLDRLVLKVAPSLAVVSFLGMLYVLFKVTGAH